MLVHLVFVLVSRTILKQHTCTCSNKVAVVDNTSEHVLVVGPRDGALVTTAADDAAAVSRRRRCDVYNTATRCW